jgi:hypothetical protein
VERESFGVEGRGGFYEEAGAIRDVVQSHLLQVLAMLAMEPPIGSSPDALRDEKVKLLKAIRPPTPQDVVRGQFRGYRDEPGVAPDSDVRNLRGASASDRNVASGGGTVSDPRGEVHARERHGGVGQAAGPLRSASSPAWRSRTMPRTISDFGSVRRSRSRSARRSSPAATFPQGRGNPSSSSLAETDAG